MWGVSIGFLIGHESNRLEKPTPMNMFLYFLDVKDVELAWSRFGISIQFFNFRFHFGLVEGYNSPFWVWGGVSILVPENPIGFRQKNWPLILIERSISMNIGSCFCFFLRLQFHDVLDIFLFNLLKSKLFANPSLDGFWWYFSQPWKGVTGDAVISNVLQHTRHIFSVGTRLWCLRRVEHHFFLGGRHWRVGFYPQKKLVEKTSMCKNTIIYISNWYFFEGFNRWFDSVILMARRFKWATSGRGGPPVELPVVGGYSWRTRSLCSGSFELENWHFWTSRTFLLT